jgi:hypothetical protein
MMSLAHVANEISGSGKKATGAYICFFATATPLLLGRIEKNCPKEQFFRWPPHQAYGMKALVISVHTTKGNAAHLSVLLLL